MKRLFPLLVIFSILCFNSCRRQQTMDSPTTDLSSVDIFFDMAARISAGEKPSDDDWEKLFLTRGYSVYFTSDEMRKALRDALITAFCMDRPQERERILAWDGSVIYQSVYNYMLRMCLDNFLDMKEHWQDLLEFRQECDFDAIAAMGLEKLHEFLKEPGSSFFRLSSLSLSCYEQDGHSRGEDIIMDFNLFYKQTAEENAGFWAHEMFHTYRYGEQGEKYREWILSDPFIFAIDRISDEGIADLIDKPEDVPEYFRSKGVSPALTARYEEAWANTPAILARLDSLAMGFDSGLIREDIFRETMSGYFSVGGHPNGLYMSRLIVKAGLLDELLEKENLRSPFAFLRIYDRAARQIGGFTFSDDFMRFIDRKEAAAS